MVVVTGYTKRMRVGLGKLLGPWSRARRGPRWVSVALVCLGNLAAASAHAFNPVPLADDVLLPMPCDEVMALRRVEIVGDGFLGEGAAVIGARRSFDDRLATHMAGAWPAQAATAALVGKYEVTRGQFEAIARSRAGLPCQHAGIGADIPQTGLTWVDANTLAGDYSRWLAASANEYPDCGTGGSQTHCIPRLEGMTAHARLPTSEEWELAARAGELPRGDVEASPFAGRLERHVWYLDSASGEPMAAGTRLPNALGFHDMLGNVEEWLLEPYRLRLDLRRHGRAGACEVRGGSFATPKSRLHPAARREVDCYAGNADIGVRLTVSLPISTSLSRSRALTEALERRPRIAEESDACDRPDSGGLRVEADADAEVLVDGRVVGRVGPAAPLRITDLSPGEHFVSARLADGRSLEPTRYTIKAGEDTLADLLLRALPPPASGGSDEGADPAVVRSPFEWELALALTREDWRSIEVWLASFGYSPGAEDGIVDQQTRTAVRAAQRDNGMEVTGYVTAGLYDLLSAAASR